GIFGRQHDVLAAVAEDLAEDRLGAAHVRVNVGGVEQRDAEIDRLVDHLARGFEVDAHAEIVAADADCGDAQAGAAEIANFHVGFPWEGKGDRYCDAAGPRPQGASLPYAIYRASMAALAR